MSDTLFTGTDDPTGPWYIQATLGGGNAWVPDGEAQVTAFGQSGALNRQWLLKADPKKRGYTFFQHIVSGKFAQIKETTGDIIVGDEKDAKSFCIRQLSDPRDYSILEDAEHTKGWTISESSPLVVLRETKEGLLGHWHFYHV